MDADEAIERAVALATTLGGDGGGDDVDMRLVGQLLADCKDARTEAASEAAWSLYQAAVVAGTAVGSGTTTSAVVVQASVVEAEPSVNMMEVSEVDAQVGGPTQPGNDAVV